MTTRRRFIWLMPASGAALLAACSDPASPPAAAPAAPASSAEYPLPPPAPAEAPAPAPAAAPVAAGPLVEETDPTAVALSYVSDAARVDKAKHTKFSDGQACGSCQLFQGAGADTGPCPLFPGKQVSAKGWCASYVKRA